MQLSPSDLALLRQRPHQANLFLSIYRPKTLMQAQVMSGTYNLGDIQINYMNVATGTYLNLYADQTVLIGTSAGSDDVGRLRMRNATGTYITFAENAINWMQGMYLTFIDVIDIQAIYPRIIQDPNNQDNVIFYKDYNIPYSNQNSIYGTFPNAGPHRAGFISSGTFFFSATGTYNLLNESLTYDWAFEGGTPTGSTALTPGNVRWNTPGHYKTRLRVTSASGAVDETYRYVSLYNRPSEGTNTPILQWELQNLSGSRSEGGYTASFKVYQDVGDVQPNAIVVLFSDNTYGSNRVNLGGNAVGNPSIVFVGYIISDSIKFNYQTSSVEFSVGSVSEMMKNAEGFSVSCESKASPSTWFELYEMNIPRAMYHYLRWHSTVLKVTDFQYTGDNRLVQYFDSDRGSLYDAVDTFLREGMLGELVSDRQGKLWAEISSFGLENPFSSLPNYLTLQKQDWMETPSINERRNSDMSFIELGGIAYYGVSSNRFSALLSNSPSVAPLYHGKSDRKEGLILVSQAQLNQIAGNYLAYNNSQFPEIPMSLNGIYTNLDIAPQERHFLVVSANDTVRNKSLQGLSYFVDSMDWKYSSTLQTLTPDIVLHQIATGTAGVTVEIPVTPPDNGYSYPSLNLPPLPVFGASNPVGSTIPSRMLLHDPTYGLFYTDTFDSNNPQWITVNGGLTAGQYGAINYVGVCPNGVIYVAYIPASTPNNAFIARAPYIGAPFTVIYDCSNPALNGGDPFFQIWSCAIHPTSSEQFAFIMGTQASRKFYLGGGGAYAQGATMSATFTIGFGTHALSYGQDCWLATGASGAQRVSLNGASILSSPSISPAMGSYNHMRPILATDKRVYQQSGNDFYVGVNNYVTPAAFLGTFTNLNFMSSFSTDYNTADVDPTGQFMMGRQSVGNKAKSSDFGATMSPLPNLPPGNWWFRYAGQSSDSVSGSRWVAAGGTSVRFSPDFGNTWLNKEGNITAIAPIPNINFVYVPGVSV